MLRSADLATQYNDVRRHLRRDPKVERTLMLTLTLTLALTLTLTLALNLTPTLTRRATEALREVLLRPSPDHHAQGESSGRAS